LGAGRFQAPAALRAGKPHHRVRHDRTNCQTNHESTTSKRRAVIVSRVRRLSTDRRLQIGRPSSCPANQSALTSSSSHGRSHFVAARVHENPSFFLLDAAITTTVVLPK